MTGAITVAGNLTIATAGETFADGGFTITVNGNVTNNATHSGAGEILLSGGAGSHTVTGTTDAYGTLELNDANGATFAKYCRDDYSRYAHRNFRYTYFEFIYDRSDCNDNKCERNACF